GSTVFTGNPVVTLESTEDAETKLSELAPGQKAVIRADGNFALTSATGTDVYTNSVTGVPAVPAVPNLVAAEFTINETALDGITIGRL
ncbi:hypothetical protein ACKI1O_50810, partial [Streptomyces scabiei]